MFKIGILNILNMQVWGHLIALVALLVAYLTFKKATSIENKMQKHVESAISKNQFAKLQPWLINTLNAACNNIANKNNVTPTVYIELMKCAKMITTLYNDWNSEDKKIIDDFHVFLKDYDPQLVNKQKNAPAWINHITAMLAIVEKDVHMI